MASLAVVLLAEGVAPEEFTSSLIALQTCLYVWHPSSSAVSAAWRNSAWYIHIRIQIYPTLWIKCARRLEKTGFLSEMLAYPLLLPPCRCRPHHQLLLKEIHYGNVTFYLIKCCSHIPLKLPMQKMRKRITSDLVLVSLSLQACQNALKLIM